MIVRLDPQAARAARPVSPEPRPLAVQKALDHLRAELPRALAAELGVDEPRLAALVDRLLDGVP